MKTLAERLKEAMKGPPSVTPAELARACGVKQPSVSDWLSGKTQNLKGNNLYRASAYLKVNPAWLSEGRGHMRKGGGAEPFLPVYEDKLSQRGLRIVSRLVEAESGGVTDESIYRIIEHALSLALKGAAAEPVVISPEEKQNMVALYEQLPAHRREALISFIKSWIVE